jgi:DTW domain-containing protein YfiP
MAGMSVQNCEVIMYYATKELGRTPNTAHIFESLLPYCSSRLVQGDEMREQQLIAEMVAEHRSGQVRTCILYPTKESQLLSEWSKAARATWSIAPAAEGGGGTDGEESVSSASVREEQPMKVRLIALDGTYACASRLYRHLDRCLRAALGSSDPDSVVVPVVKLDLGAGGVRSAILGIMEQPGAEKVCTFQALVLAFKQLDESPKLCSSLLRDLDAWLEHILSMNIKMTKSAQAVEKKASHIGLGEGEERAPPEYVRRAMARNMERHEANLAKGRWTEHKKKIMREKGQARAEAEAEGEESWPLNEEGDNFGHNCRNKTPTSSSTCSFVGLRSLLDAIFGGIFGIGAEDKDTATAPMEVDEKEDDDEVAVASSCMCYSK